jgi:hypothetical protein
MKRVFWTMPGAGRIGATIALLALLLPVPTEAVDAPPRGQQPTGLGSLSASGIGPLPPAGTTINIELAGDDAGFRYDRLHEQARLAAVQALQAWGYEPVERGSPVLQIRVSMAPGPIRRFETPTGARPDLQPGEIPPIPDSARVPVLEPQVRVPFGRALPRPTGSYTITLTLFERGREPLWVATTTVSGNIPDAEALVRTLTRTAMNDLGTTVQRDFALSCEDEDVARGSLCLE